MGIQRFKKHLSDSVINADNASLASMDTSSFLGSFDDDASHDSGKKVGGGAKAIAMELDKVIQNECVYNSLRSLDFAPLFFLIHALELQCSVLTCVTDYDQLIQEADEAAARDEERFASRLEQ
jgi:hypothetical protein